MLNKYKRFIYLAIILVSVFTVILIRAHYLENHAFTVPSPIFTLGGSSGTQFTVTNNVYQDCDIALYRDSSGILWGILGRSENAISVWKGTNIDNMTKQYNISLNFALGAAGKAFNGFYYPDGPRSRGQIWPTGLYIDPSGKFYCYIHNETGWFAGGTGYTLSGQSESEPDYRHLGLMVSNDQGRTWNFVGWVLTAHIPCYSTSYEPDGGKYPNPQTGPIYCLGAGDNSIFVNNNYIYVFYSEIFCDIKGNTSADRVYVARANKNDPLTFYKYYNGSFSQPGNCGMETAILGDTASEPNVAWSAYLNKYIMTSYNPPAWNYGKGGWCAAQISTSSDLVHWSAPQLLNGDSTMSKPYWTICNTDNSGDIKVVGQKFRLLYSFGGDVRKVDTTIHPDRARSRGQQALQQLNTGQ